MPLTLSATLYAGIARLEMVVETENVCEDHCLHAVFETGLSTRTASAYDHFNVIERPARAPAEAEWRDEPFQEFVDVSDGVRGLCVATRGLPAYQAIAGETGTSLHLTLLRAVGLIGDPSGYPAGVIYDVPGAQCPGPQRFEYALIPHAGSWLEGDCLAAASEYRTPLLVEADLPHGGDLPPRFSMLSLEHTGTVAPFQSCLKPAEDGSGALVLRLWNPEGAQTAGLTAGIPLQRIALASLDERVTKEVDVDQAQLHLPARGLTTVIVTPA
jgi:alpha-mannosidase